MAFDVYRALLRLYPQSFQAHYALTMRQTFDDMLRGETNAFGRLRVWTRTLADLPLSATREHIHNGEELHMNKYTKLVIGALVAVLVLGNIGSFWFGNLHALKNAGVEKVSVSQLADAMQQDHFYSSYGSTAVLFRGTVTSVLMQASTTLVTFSTGRPYAVECQFPSSVSFKQNDTISIAAPGGSAERLPQGVLLHDCVVD